MLSFTLPHVFPNLYAFFFLLFSVGHKPRYLEECSYNEIQMDPKQDPLAFIKWRKKKKKIMTVYIFGVNYSFNGKSNPVIVCESTLA